MHLIETDAFVGLDNLLMLFETGFACQLSHKSTINHNIIQKIGPQAFFSLSDLCQMFVTVLSRVCE